MSQIIEPRRATSLTFVALGVLFVLASGTLFWMARAVNYDALLRSHIQVQNALQHGGVIQHNPANILHYDPETQSAVFGDRAPVSPELAGAVRRFSSGVTFQDANRGAVRADGEVIFLQRDFGGAVTGWRVNSEFLAEVSQSLLFGPLAFSETPEPTDVSVALIGPDGSELGFVTWDKPTPGSVLLRQKMLPMGVLALACAVFAAIAIWRTRNCAIEMAKAGNRQALTARTDQLTGLPNRRCFSEHLQGIGNADPGSVAILYMDVNQFKRVNDTVGHGGGDELIIQLGKRLSDLKSDSEFFARVGGDEFVFVVERPEAERRVRDLGILVRERMEDAFDLQGHAYRLSLSLGYSVWGADQREVSELLAQADMAMYHAKRLNLAAPVAFDRAIETNRKEVRLIEDALRHAVRKGGEFSILYQPVIDSVTGKMVKAEALARWTSEILGRIPPEKFIAVAEDSGLIIEVGGQLFDLICDDLVRAPGLIASINFSPLQLQAPMFIPELIDAFHARRIAPERVEIELTESVVVDDPELSAFRVDLLNEAGFSTALDDFGTGYSSLASLRTLPFKTLKIDSSFITGLDGDAPNRQLIKAICGLGHSLGQRVVAEGVETEGQVNALRDLGCDMMQGYYFDRPLELKVLVDRWLHDAGQPIERDLGAG